MFRIIYTILLSSILLSVNSFHSQVTITASADTSCGGGPPITLTASSNIYDCSNSSAYIISDVTYAPLTLSSSATTVSLSDDAVSASLPIGFTFNFFCNDYTQFRISSNGFITFNNSTASGCCSGQNLPNTSTPNNLIAFAWEDIDPGNGGQPAENLIRYETVGTAPNRILIVDFYNVDHFSNGNNITVQTLLYEADNSIEIHTTTMPSDGGNHTMGLENIDGTVAVTVAGRNSANWSASNECKRFAPNTTGCSTTIYDWQSPLGTSIGSGTSITVTPNVTTTYYVVATNSCGSATTSKDITVLFIDAGNDQCTGGGTITLNPTTNFPSSCSNYSISNISFAPLSLSGSATTVSLSDDAVSASLPIGFTFNFFCNDYTQFRISSNGFITFNNSTANGCCSGQNLPNTSNPNNLVAFAWEDIDPGNGGQPAENLIRYETVGTAPNRILIVDFYNVDHFSNGNNITVQTLLYEADNSIEIHTTTMPSDGGNHTMGLENIDGTQAFTVTGRNSTSWSANNEGIRFSHPTTSTILWSPATGLSSTTILNPQASPTTKTLYTITIDDGNGCILSDNVYVDPNCPLPIELVSFSGICNDNKIDFFWTTAAEIDNNFFTIEYLSSNTWIPIGEVQGAGNSNEIINYHYEHSGKEGYYRLKQTDFDGKFDYSGTIKIDCDASSAIKGFPNPANDYYTVIIDKDDGEITTVNIYDAYGKNIIHRATSQKQITLDIKTLRPGLYTVSVSSKFLNKVMKLIVQ